MKKRQAGAQKKMTRVKFPAGSTHYHTITGRQISIPDDRIIEVTDEELPGALIAGGQKVDPWFV